MEPFPDFDSKPLPEFSSWFGFLTRLLHLKSLPQHGVYILARFEGSPPKRNATPLPPEVFYVGKAPLQTFEERLDDFEQAAFHGKDDHNAGTCYRKKFPNDDGSKLFVAVYPPKPHAWKLDDTNIMWVERETVRRYEKRYGHKPACNEIMPPG